MYIDDIKSSADFHASNVTAIKAAIAIEQATIDNSNATAVDKAMATAAKEWLTRGMNEQQGYYNEYNTRYTEERANRDL